jgi:hypothetical protein
MNSVSLFRQSAGVTAVLAAAAGAWAQPVGVTVTDLGDFGRTVSTTQTRNITLSPAAPVAWFKIRVPRIAPPHRYLDISTSGAGFGDSEIALFAADGTLIATDDDDGANNFSALSFGMVTPGAFGRPAPVAQAGQSAGEPNNGRDGTLSGLASIERGGTAGDYYIAVARFDSTFGNNFGVVPPGGTLTLATLLTVRMDTPGGQVAPTVDGIDNVKIVGDDRIEARASTNLSATSVTIDASAVGGPSNAGISGSSGSWSGQVVVPAFTSVGEFPIVYRASNAIGDVTIDEATLTIRPRTFRCGFANRAPISTTPGTTIYTYTTTLGTVDGPWTTACFVSTPTGNDVWFRFEPTQTGTLTLSTCNSDTGVVGGQPDTLLGFRGRCDDAGFSTCGDDVGGCGIGTRLNNIPVTAGLEYNIAVRAFSDDIVDGKLAVTFTPGCDDIDFNNNGVFPEDQDVVDFFDVLAGGNPPTCDPIQGCNDIDFNNNGVFPEDQDVVDFFNLLAGGTCG